MEGGAEALEVEHLVEAHAEPALLDAVNSRRREVDTAADHVEPTTGLALNAPFGGFKQSSANTFKEMGQAALDFYTRTKTINVGHGWMTEPRLSIGVGGVSPAMRTAGVPWGGESAFPTPDEFSHQSITIISIGESSNARRHRRPTARRYSALRCSSVVGGTGGAGMKLLTELRSTRTGLMTVRVRKWISGWRILSSRMLAARSPIW
jgi:hypothetical protein